MTPRERLSAAIEGQPTDRLAWAPELNDAFIRKIMRQEGLDPRESGNTYVTGNQLVGGDTLQKVIPYEPHMMWESGETADRLPHVRVERRVEGDRLVRRYVLSRGELTSVDLTVPEAHTTYRVDHPIKSVDDFAVYRDLIEGFEFRPRPDRIEALERSLGEAGIISLTGPETPLMGFIMYHCGIEPSLYLLMDHEREMVDLMDAVHQRNLEVYRMICQMPGRMVRPFEDTSSSLTAPWMYEKYCAPYLNDYADVCHQHGKLFIVHMCGLLKEMLPLIAGTRIDGIEAMTPPPTGNCPPELAREFLPGALLIGGMDPTRLVGATPQGVEEMVGGILDRMAGDRRFILGSEEIPVGAELDTVRRIGAVLDRYGPWGDGRGESASRGAGTGPSTGSDG
jgi:hypothetical protein